MREGLNLQTLFNPLSQTRSCRPRIDDVVVVPESRTPSENGDNSAYHQIVTGFLVCFCGLASTWQMFRRQPHLCQRNGSICGGEGRCCPARCQKKGGSMCGSGQPMGVSRWQRVQGSGAPHSRARLSRWVNSRAALGNSSGSSINGQLTRAAGNPGCWAEKSPADRDCTVGRKH